MQKRTLLTHCSKVFQTGLPFKLLFLALLISLLPLSMAEADTPPTEVDEVTIWLRSGPEDWMWGYADLNAFVTVTKDATPLFTVQADGMGFWQSPDSFEINEGDSFVVTAGAGINPVPVYIPTPFSVQADSSTDQVWGQIDHLDTEPVSVWGDWSGGHQDVLTDSNGNFSAPYGDVPYGGAGYVVYETMSSWADIIYQQEFQTPDLVLETHYGYDWIQGHYDTGHTVWLSLYESDKVTLKASAELETIVTPWWDGETGFSSDLGENWSPERPDIAAGDWIYGEVDNGYYAWVQIGDITGSVDTSAESIGGTLSASWLMPGPVNIDCTILGEGPPQQYDTVIPNGSDTYECDWSGVWDIMPGDRIRVAYFEPDGHIIMRDFHEPAPHLAIQKWYIGNGLPGEGGNAAYYVQYINMGDAPAENVTITDSWSGMDYLGDTSGFSMSTGSNFVTWDLGTVTPGEWVGFVIYGDVTATEGNPISNAVVISTSSFDLGEPSEKTSIWEGTVAPSGTHLKVWKETWTGNPAPGEEFVYQINVCNDGEIGSSTLTLTDTLPDDVAFNEWWTFDAGWYEMDQTGQMLELLNYSIQPGGCHSIFINVTLDEFALPGEGLVNRAEIAADNDLETEDNIAELYHEVGEPYVDAAVWQDWHSGSMVPGGWYRLGIGYRNNGNFLIHSPLEITATLPAGVTYAGSDLTPTSLTATTVTWEIGADMIAGMEGMFELQLNIDPAVAPDTVLNNIVDIAISDVDENSENDHHELIVIVRDHGMNLRVTKDGGWEGDQVGQVAWWYIQLENIGDALVEDIALTDYYPDEMELMGGIYVNYWGDWSWSDNIPEDNAFHVDIAGLEPGERINIEYRTYVREEVTVIPGMQFSNIVEVPYDGDINPPDNVFETIIITPPGFSTFLPMILK